ncbi:DoxX family protein [Bradyrhizobium sp.]|uniref:DoxX family protein n=1 Tax=Bradyrhizobium sp. TaxID=376 RepID=UPI000AAA78D6|nr:DoxX family protein [Bradyrhizobium sp.]
MTLIAPLQRFLKRNGRFSDPIFRVSLSLIFVIGGLGHFVEHRQMLERIAESPWANAINMIGNPSVLLWVSGAIFVPAGLALAAGFLTQLSSVVLFVTLVPITITMHVAPGHAGPLFKNIAILGALIHFVFNGSGAVAIDRALALTIEPTKGVLRIVRRRARK